MAETLLLFLRYPEPGRTKTRLIPRLGAEGAAALYRRMAERVAEVVRAVDRPALTRIACFEPAARREEVERWLGPGFEVLAQPEADLGGRLEAGFAAAFAGGARRVVALGTDCVEVTPELLAGAFAALGDHDAVVGPARDGGYWLIGLSRPAPEAFRGIPFSTDRTFAATMARLAEAGLRVRVLPELRDIDRPEDLDAGALPPAGPGWRGALTPGPRAPPRRSSGPRRPPPPPSPDPPRSL